MCLGLLPAGSSCCFSPVQNCSLHGAIDNAVCSPAADCCGRFRLVDSFMHDISRGEPGPGEESSGWLSRLFILRCCMLACYLAHGLNFLPNVNIPSFSPILFISRSVKYKPVKSKTRSVLFPA